MSELMEIDSNIRIDNIYDVLTGISELSGKHINSPETIKRFIAEEKSTKFYINNKGQAKMQQDKDSLYVWIDSGFTDMFGQGIFISLLRQQGEYVGHYYGTVSELSDNIRRFFPKNIKEINRNISHFKEKYRIKVSERKHAHIDDEQKYLLSLCNEDHGTTIMSELIKTLGVMFTDSPEMYEEPEDKFEQTETEEVNYSLSVRERNITIDLLLETIDEMQDYINDLRDEVKKYNEDKEKSIELEKRNEELTNALTQVRNYSLAQEVVEDIGQKPSNGHDLLGRRGKILVLGASTLDSKTMAGIAKQYGFEKGDFEYFVDYEKIKSFVGRGKDLGKYAAVILGAIPHKVQNLGDWSSFIQKCAEDEMLPFAIDARSHAGELKVTKESYRRALLKVCKELWN